MKSYAIVLLLIIVGAGCKSTETSAPANPNSATAATPAPAAVGIPPASTTSPAPSEKSEINACNLLSSEDLKNVQGVGYKETQRSDHEDRGLVVSQCYYQLPNMADSVVINVTTPKRGGGALNPRDFWEETFHKNAERERGGKTSRDQKKEKVSEHGGEAEAEGIPPEKINGLGQEAFWSASRVGGALYVKRNDYMFFRISVGGADNASTRLNKSKRLAQLILKKLGSLAPEG